LVVDGVVVVEVVDVAVVELDVEGSEVEDVESSVSTFEASSPSPPSWVRTSNPATSAITAARPARTRARAEVTVGS
jgi:hypothetical protein